ncbi:MAG: YhdT family protein [Clostridia bacterium]|nr:YhdT family protein [Clostridia bacterium]
MKQLTKQEKHDQCIREIKGTLLVVAICCLWHVVTAFALNGTGFYFLGMPAWFSVSVFGTIILAIIGVVFLVKKVFVDFEYDEEVEEAVYDK